jgi:prepilin-type N-terminal cleavage/methylation domain-containing protein
MTRSPFNVVAASLPPRSKMAHCRLRRALTLLEILIAMALFASAMLPIWAVFSSSSENIAEGESESQVLNLAGAFLGQARRFNPALVPVTTADVVVPMRPDGRYHLGGPSSVNTVRLPEWDDRALTLSFRVQLLPSLPRGGKLLLLKIDWKGKTGRAHRSVFPEILGDE